MNWKIALLLLVVVFAPVVTVAAVGLNTPELNPIPIPTLEKTALRIVFKPAGDPIDSPIGPHQQ